MSIRQRVYENGFTLLELMSIIAILGILATLAIPAYQRYSGRARFAEVVQAATPFKMAVLICANENNSLKDCSAGKHGIPKKLTGVKASHVKSVDVQVGVITVTAQGFPKTNSGQPTYVLTPTINDNGQITWKKSGTCVERGYC